MSPSARAAAGTLVIVLACAYYQLTSAKSAHDWFTLGAAHAVLIQDVREAVAKSPHPELYASGRTLDCRVLGVDPSSGAVVSLTAALRYALAPAVVTRDPAAEYVVIVFAVQEHAAPFVAANRAKLVEVLSENVHVYRREQN